MWGSSAEAEIPPRRMKPGQRCNKVKCDEEQKNIKCEVVTLYGQFEAVYAEASPCKAGMQQMLSMPVG